MYDSLGKALPLDTKKQVAAILHSPDKEIKFEYANVQVRMITILFRLGFMVFLLNFTRFQAGHLGISKTLK